MTSIESVEICSAIYLYLTMDTHSTDEKKQKNLFMLFFKYKKLKKNITALFSYLYFTKA